MLRSPKWTREECILALDLFVRAGRKQVDKRRPEIVELSGCLQQLPIYSLDERGTPFRNPGSVAMKLGNFCALDPECPGKGRPNVSSLDQQVWTEFHDDELGLRVEADAIRRRYNLPPASPIDRSSQR
jgi:5-methylcytosine-specific restriction protein A